MSRLSQNDIMPKTIDNRALGNIIQVSNTASASASLAPGDEVTFVATSLSFSGERLMDYGDMSLYETSVLAANRIPGGSNITKGTYQVIGPFNDYQRTDGENSKQMVYVRNKGVTPTAFTKVVNANDDDCDETNDTTFDSLSCQVGNNAGVKDAGLRFTNITIPQGATINSATITFRGTLGAGPVGNTVKSLIKGIAEDNTAAWSSTSRPSQRTKTTASVVWDFTIVTPPASKTTVDFTSVVQEIINRAGWVSGNAMGIVIEDNASTAGNFQSFEYYENQPTLTAEISINYGSGTTKTVLIRSQGRAIINREDLS